MFNYKELKHYKIAFLWAIFILVLCNIKLPDQEDTAGFLFEGFDKITHLGLFFVLAIFLFFGKIKYQHNYSFRNLTILKIILICATLGGGIELLQWKVFTYRSGEWWDFGCDMLGCLMAVVSYFLLHLSNYNDKKV